MRSIGWPVVVLPAGSAKDANGIARSAAGFLGHEAARDPRDRPVLSSSVARIVPSAIILAGPGGDITLSLSNTAALYRLEPATGSAIREGDRIVLMAPEGGAPTGVLVLPAP